MMKSKESILSAYLDGELDPETRIRVEAAAQTNPRIARRLAELSQVRQIVASLPMVTLPESLSRQVVDRIGADQRARVRRSQRLLMASCGLAAAACLMVATFRPIVPAELSKVATSPPFRPLILLDPPKIPLSHVVSRPGLIIPPVSEAIPVEILAVEQQNRRDLVRYRDLVAGDDAKEILVEVDSLGPPTIDLVEDAIQKSNRRVPEHARLRLYHEVAADPLHPGEVAVYVLVMDDVERNLFAQNLEQNLPKSTRPETIAQTTLVAQLPQKGKLELRGGLPRGTLLPPPIHLANQDAFRDTPSPDPLGERNSDTIPEKPAKPRRPSRSEDRPTGVYVVWVTTRDGPRPGPN